MRFTSPVLFSSVFVFLEPPYTQLKHFRTCKVRHELTAAICSVPWYGFMCRTFEQKIRQFFVQKSDTDTRTPLVGLSHSSIQLPSALHTCKFLINSMPLYSPPPGEEAKKRSKYSISGVLLLASWLYYWRLSSKRPAAPRRSRGATASIPGPVV